MEKKRKTLFPVITLMLLAPFTGELLSGSSPPAEYFQPLTFFLLTYLYGLGALLIRETVRRWERGWLAVLFMGMAYGIFEEGLVVRSFFDPAWGDLGLLADYGRWIGVNWVWAIALTIFHAVVSISIPIALTELIFPAYRDERWLGKKGFNIILLLFLIYLFAAPLFGMRITILGFIACIITIILLLLLANTWTEDGVPLEKPNKKWNIISAGFLSMIGLITGMWVLPALSIPSLITFLLLCFAPWFGYRWFKRLGMKDWSEKESWSAVFGLLIPWFISGIASELNIANRSDDTRGMGLVVGVFIILMVILRLVIVYREHRRREDVQ